MRRALPFVAAAFCVHTAFAQSTTTAPARFEFMSGANFANLSTPSDGEGASDARTAFVAGVGVIKPFAPGWAFQPELTYSMKGAKASDTGGELTAKLSYIEVPLLMRYEVESQGGVRPFAQVGPALALKVGCRFVVSSSTVSASQSCDDAGNDAKAFDLGLMLGGGLAFRQTNYTFSVGIRYDLGLIDIADGSDSKNRVWSVVGTFEWPWGK